MDSACRRDGIAVVVFGGEGDLGAALHDESQGSCNEALRGRDLEGLVGVEVLLWGVGWFSLQY